MTENPTPIKSEEPLCGIMIYFPVPDGLDVMGILKKIQDVLIDVPRVKTDLKITQVKDDGNKLGHESGLS